MDDLRIKLLQEQRERGLTGFTPAYLIGAHRNPIGNTTGNNNQDYGEFVEMLSFFQNPKNTHNHYVGISECVKLKQPVIALYSSLDEIKEYGLDNISSNNKASLLYSSSKYHKKGSFESLVEKLWSLSEQHISSGNFSFNNGMYSKFSKDEVHSITKAKNA